MRRDIVCVSYGSSYKELRDMLNNYSYSSFALVDSAGESAIITRTLQILIFKINAATHNCDRQVRLIYVWCGCG